MVRHRGTVARWYGLLLAALMSASVMTDVRGAEPPIPETDIMTEVLPPPVASRPVAKRDRSSLTHEELIDRLFTAEERLQWLEEVESARKSRDSDVFRNISHLNMAAAEEEKKKEEKADPKAFKASWKHGLNFESNDKNFAVHLGGRTQIDTVFLESNPAAFGAGNNAGDNDSANFRRARLRADGTIYKTIDYVVEYDFVNASNDNAGLVGGLPGQPNSAANVIHVPAPTDAYFTFKETPIVGNVRVGQLKEPIGLEHMTSSRYLDFMERSFNQDAYTGPSNNGFSLGAAAFNNFSEDDRGLWTVGVFKNSVNAFAYAVDDGAYAVDGRMTYLLWDENDGGQLMHIGGSFSHRDPILNQLRIRSRGSLRNGPGPLNPVFADSGLFTTDAQDLAGAEFAMVLGSFQLQSEYILSNAINATNGGGNHGTYSTHGYYVMASYFLTGEHRTYDKKAGTFVRVIPFKNSRWCPQDCSEGGWGAWQVLARYSNLDLSDSGINGGQLQDYTLGLNWFLNPNMKIQANYVATDRDSLGSPTAPGAGVIHGFGMRIAHDF